MNLPGGSLPGGSLPGGGFKPTIPATGGGKANFPQGIGDAPKKAAIDIDRIKFNPDKGMPSGGGSSSVGTTKTPATTTAGEPVLVVTPTTSASKEIILEAVKGEYQYARLGLWLGVLAIVGGVILGLNGVAGSTSWTANLLGLKSQVNDAAPGTVLFIIGLFMIWATRPKIKMRDLQG